MANLDYCFFCLKYIPKVETDFHPKNCEIENYKDHVFRISHYLKVPREVIQADEQVPNKIITCLDCTDISKNLSDSCVQLEVIKMKISHYLHLLTDKIKGISTEAQDSKKGCHRLNLSNLQKRIHKNCLEKVQKDEDSSNPQIRLVKCPTLPNHLPEETTVDIKLEYGLVNLCPCCDFVTSGPYEIIQSHLEAQHLEHVKIEQVEDESSNCEYSEVLVCDEKLENHKVRIQKQPKLTANSRIALNCKKCGKSFSYSGSLSRHLRESSTCGIGGRKRAEFKDRFECSICNRRFCRGGHLRRHLKNVCKMGMFIDHGLRYSYANQGDTLVKENEDMVVEQDPLQL